MSLDQVAKLPGQIFDESRGTAMAVPSVKACTSALPASDPPFLNQDKLMPNATVVLQGASDERASTNHEESEKIKRLQESLSELHDTLKALESASDYLASFWATVDFVLHVLLITLSGLITVAHAILNGVDIRITTALIAGLCAAQAAGTAINSHLQASKLVGLFKTYQKQLRLIIHDIETHQGKTLSAQDLTQAWDNIQAKLAQHESNSDVQIPPYLVQRFLKEMKNAQEKTERSPASQAASQANKDIP